MVRGDTMSDVGCEDEAQCNSNRTEGGSTETRNGRQTQHGKKTRQLVVIFQTPRYLIITDQP